MKRTVKSWAASAVFASIRWLGRAVLVFLRPSVLEPLRLDEFAAIHIVVAHPDDELLAVAGLISKAIAGGHETTVHYVNGISDSVRLMEAKECAKELGFTVELGPLGSVFPEDLVATFGPWDGHPEHRDAAREGVSAALGGGCGHILLFGIFTPMTSARANTAVRHDVDKRGLFARVYPSQRYLSRAVSSLSTWERMHARGSGSDFVEAVRIADPRVAMSWTSLVPAPYPRANTVGCWSYLGEVLSRHRQIHRFRAPANDGNVA